MLKQVQHDRYRGNPSPHRHLEHPPTCHPERVSGSSALQSYTIFVQPTIATSTRMKAGYVYIMSNRTRTTLYIGVTSNLLRRVLEHRKGLVPGFTQRYRLKELVYYECYPNMYAAIQREKQLKRWHRQWKWNLIRQHNPELRDLTPEILGDTTHNTVS